MQIRLPDHIWHESREGNIVATTVSADVSIRSDERFAHIAIKTSNIVSLLVVHNENSCFCYSSLDERVIGSKIKQSTDHYPTGWPIHTDGNGH